MPSPFDKGAELVKKGLKDAVKKVEKVKKAGQETKSALKTGDKRYYKKVARAEKKIAKYNIRIQKYKDKADQKPDKAERYMSRVTKYENKIAEAEQLISAYGG